MALESPAKVVCSSYYAVISEDNCTACGTCEDRCQLDAITVDEDTSHIDKDRCIGCGICVVSCDFDAIHVEDGLATVDYDKCVGCGACARVCPRNIITITPFKSERMLAVTCSNKDKGKDVIAVCNVGCIGCGACARASGLFTLEDNLSTINYDEYDPATCSLEILEACQKCRRQRLVFVVKPSAEDLDRAGDLEAPEVVEPDFKTTVDDTEWRG